jgi:hypothetical protein
VDAAAPQQALVVAGDRSDEHAGPAAGQCAWHDAGVLERLPRQLEHEPLLRVHRRCLARCDAEEAGIEALDAIEISASTQALRRLMRSGEAVHRPSLRRRVDDRIAALAQKLPEPIGIRCARQAMPMTAVASRSLRLTSSSRSPGGPRVG